MPTCLSKWGRTLIAGALVISALSVASAQSVVAMLSAQVEAITDVVIGRAPVVTVTIDNQARPGEAPIVGESLLATANADDPDHDAITALSYRWLRGNIEIASTNTYTVVEADRGETLSVEAIATTDAAITDPASGTGSASITVSGNTRPTAAPTITGTPKVGDQLIGNPGYADAENDPQGTHVYQWYRSDNASGTPRTAIENANAATYTPVNADQGKRLVFGIIPVSTVAPTTGIEYFAVASANVPSSAPVVTGATVAGTPRTGETLTASYTFTDAELDDEDQTADGTLYRWWRPGVILAEGRGAAFRTYVVPVSLQGYTISYDVVPRTAAGTPMREGARAYSTATTTILGRAPTMTTPIITGIVEVGKTLTATPQGFNDLDNDTETTPGYQWYQVDNAAGDNPVMIDAATAGTYVIQSADVGKFLMVRVTPKTSTGNPNTGIPVQAVTATASAGTAPTATPTITGTPWLGQPLTGNPGYADAENDPEGTHTYQWYRSDNASGTPRTPIAGANAAIYTPVTADKGKRLVFGIVPVSTVGPNATTEYFAVAASNVPSSYVPTMTTPLIQGIVQVGQTLTVVPQGFNDLDGDEFKLYAYKWYHADNAAGDNRVDVPFAVGEMMEHYVVRPEDVGKFLSVRVVVFTKTGLPDEMSLPYFAQTATAVVGADDGAPTAAPTITGTPAVGSTLTGNPGYSDPQNDPPGTHVYKWYRSSKANGVPRTEILGANSPTYTPVAEDLDKYLVFGVVPVSTVAPNAGVQHFAVAATKVVANTAPTATPTITGTPWLGQPLTGTPGYADAENDPEGTHTYQWYRSDNASGTPRTPIAGANAAIYTPVTADKGKRLVFGIIPASTVGPNATTEYFAVAASNVPSSYAPTMTTPLIEGVVQVGQTLTAVHQGFEDLDGDLLKGFGIKWYQADNAAGDNRVGITDSYAPDTYVVRPEDVGKFISVRLVAVTFTGQPDEMSLPYFGQTATAVVGAADGAPTAAPTITGTPAIGATLTGNPGYSDPQGDPPGAHLYKWYRSTKANGIPRTEIVGATSATYTPVAEDLDMYLVFGIVPVSTVAPTTGVQHFAIASTKVVANAPPTMTAPLIEGALGVTKVLTAVPQGFNDPDNSGEGAHVTQWFRSDDAAGEVNRVNLGTGLTYTVQLPDLYKHVGFEITPVDGLGGVGTLVRTVGAKIPNTPPTITNFRWSKNPAENRQPLSFEFDFVDPDGDLENTDNKVEWFLCSANGYVEGNEWGSCNQTLDYGHDKKLPYTNGPVLKAEDTYYWETHVVVRFRPRASSGVEYGEWVSMKTDYILGTPPTMTAPQISGTPAVGQTLTGVPQGFSDIEDVVYVPGIQVHRWYRTTDPTGVAGRGDPIATTAAYVVTEADKNFYLVYEVTPTTNRGAPFSGTPVFAVTSVAGAPPTMTAPLIEGALGVTKVLTAVPQGFDDPDNAGEGAHVTQWFRSDDAAGEVNRVNVGTGLTYTVQLPDLYKHVGFEITPVDGDGDVGTLVRTVGAKIPNTPPSIKNFRFNPAPPENRTSISIEFEFVDPDGDIENTSNRVDWYLCHTDLYVDGTAPGFNCNKAFDYSMDKTKPWGVLKVEDTEYWRSHVVVAFRPRAMTGVEYGEWHYMKSDLVLGTPPKMTTPEITGTPAVGATLSGVPKGFSDIEDMYRPEIQVHRWYRTTDPTGVAGRGDPIATTAAYVVTEADKNFYLVYEVTPTTNRGAPFSGTPVFTVTTLIPQFTGSAPTASPAIGGWMVMDSAATASPNYADAENDPPGTHGFQWYYADDASGTVNRTEIPGATNEMLTIPSSAVEKYLVVGVTPRSSNGQVGTTAYGVSTSPVMPHRYENNSGAGCWFDKFDAMYNCERTFAVSGRVGNGYARSLVGISFYPQLDGMANARAELIAPDGTVYVVMPTGTFYDDVDQTHYAEVDLSGEALNGTWRIRFMSTTSDHLIISPNWLFLHL